MAVALIILRVVVKPVSHLRKPLCNRENACDLGMNLHFVQPNLAYPRVRRRKGDVVEDLVTAWEILTNCVFEEAWGISYEGE
jgi:hypothetical protein